jgi:hypothetical protein
MTRDQPGAADLLKIAREVLREDVAPAVSGETRFNVLMVANAMAMAIREVEQGAELDEAALSDLVALYEDTGATAADLSRKLARDIRTGFFDEGAKAVELHDLLMTDIRRRLAIGNPRYLAESEDES